MKLHTIYSEAAAEIVCVSHIFGGHSSFIDVYCAANTDKSRNVHIRRREEEVVGMNVKNGKMSVSSTKNYYCIE